MVNKVAGVVMGPFSKLASRSFAEWRASGQAVVLLGLLRVSLSLFSFRHVARAVKRTARFWRRPLSSDSAYRTRVVWAVSAVGRRMLRDRPCLPQALAVQFLFLRRGLPATLHIGVDKESNRLLAHAWVESEGDVVIGGRFSPYRYSELQDVEAKL